MMKFCAACGAAVGEGLAFCGQCGLAAGGATAAVAGPQRQAGAFPGWMLIVAGAAALAAIAALVWLLQPSELKPEQAQELITLNRSEPVTAPLLTEQSVFPVNLSVDPQTGAFADFHQAQINEARMPLERLRDAGYITFEEENITRYMFFSRLGNVQFRIRSTAKLDPFIVESSPNGQTLQIKIGQIVPDTILSITPIGEDQRLVRYTRKSDLNELAGLLGSAEIPADLGEAEAKFTLVDGDWVLME
jgi:hypothetical protein